MAIPPQLAHTIKGIEGSKDSSFNQTIVWANYIWMKDPKNSPPPWAKPAQKTLKQPFRDEESTRTHTHMRTHTRWIRWLLIGTHIPSRLSSKCCVSLPNTHMWHSALDQISACCSQRRWGGLRGLRLNGKHSQEPFPNAPPIIPIHTLLLPPPTAESGLHPCSSAQYRAARVRENRSVKPGHKAPTMGSYLCSCVFVKISSVRKKKIKPVEI